MTGITLERSVQAILARITDDDMDAARSVFERAAARHGENARVPPRVPRQGRSDA
ncbi:MAG TPA: hypothetical protein VHA75_00740 [Rugosimonospora sp.]|nr:hypothetical protein [Rugosimonospora sp.]